MLSQRQNLDQNLMPLPNPTQHDLTQHELEQLLLTEIAEFETCCQPVLQTLRNTTLAAPPANSLQARDIRDQLTILSPQLQKFHQIEKKMRPLRQQWIDQEWTLSPVLKQRIQLYQNSLNELITGINLLEQSARAVQLTTGHEIDSLVQHQKMQKAYQRQHPEI